MSTPVLTPDTRQGIESIFEKAKQLGALQISIIVGEIRIDAVFDTSAPLNKLTDEELY